MKNVIIEIIFGFLVLSVNNLQSQNNCYTLLVGLEYVDANAYGIEYNNEATSGVPNDLIKLNQIAIENNHIISILKNENATKLNIINEFHKIGRQIKENDYLLFYFTGHGDMIKDLDNDESSGYDQVLVSFDAHIIDDEIDHILSRYFSKTRNIMIIDACHSSSSYKLAEFTAIPKTLIDNVNLNINEVNSQQYLILENPCLYENERDPTKSYNLIYFGATRDHETAGGDISGGVLTNWLFYIYDRAVYENLWNTYTYEMLACEISMNLPGNEQILQFHEIGPTTSTYIKSNPFKID